MSLHCFIQTQAPIPGSTAQPVRYPACEWVGDDGTVDHQHPLNRCVCSWLTSDMVDVAHCDEVLHAMMHIEAGIRKEWFVDGDAFHVDIRINGVQFNQSNVSVEDTVYWNQIEGQFTVSEVTTLLLAWRDFLAASARP